MQVTRTVDPVSPPVTLAEIKAHCRVLHADDDDDLAALVTAATAYLDGPTGILGRCLLTQTWRVDLQDWSDPIYLPVNPVASVVVTYIDQAGAEQTLSAGAYTLTNAEGAAPAIWPKAGTQLPQLGDVPYPVRIVAECGQAACPADIKVAVKMLVGHWHQNRTPVSAAAMTELPMAVTALLLPHRRLVW